MTSHKYLNKKKGAAYTFFSGLQSAILPAVILAVIESLIFAAVPASVLSSEKKGLGPLSTKKLSDSIKFVTSILEEPGAAIAFCVAIALLCIFTAVILLRFMADKRTVNVYYSLGIKRRTLFLSRYFAGAVMITAATIIPIVAGFFVNLAFLKLSWQLSIVYIHLFFGLWILSLLAYSLSAAVFSSVGTVSEGIVYSLGVMTLPTILLVSLENMLSAFVPSSTFDTQIVAFDSSGYFQSISAQSLIFRYERYNPLLFFADEFYKYARGAILSSGGIELTDKSVFSFPNMGISLFWLPVCIALTALGCFMFVRRNAENCGFLNTNKILANAVLFELLITAVSVPLYEVNYMGTGEIIAICSVAAFGAYIFFEIFLKRNVKRILKTLYKFPAHAAIIGLIIVTFSSGLFGFARYIPNTSDISAAAVSVPVSIAPLQIRTTTDLSYGYSSNYFVNARAGYSYNELPQMTSESDIKKVTDLHEKLVKANTDDDGSIATLTFRYVLKNGRTESRKVFVKDYSLLKESVTLLDTDACKAQYEELFGTDWNKLKNADGKFADYPNSFYGAMIYDNSVVSFTPVSMQENYLLTLTDKEFSALREALKKDLLSMTSDEVFDGDASKKLGVLSFTSTVSDNDIEGITGIGNEQVSEVEATPSEVLPDDKNTEEENPDEELPDEELPDGENEAENSKLHYTVRAKTEVYTPYDRNYNIIVTQNMTNTVKVLKDAGLDGAFTSKLKIKSLSFVKLNFDSMQDFIGARTIQRDITAYVPNGDAGYYYDDDSIQESANRLGTDTENFIKDEKRITEVMSRCSLRRLLNNGDFICVADYGDGLMTCYPLTAADAPDYVTQHTYTVNSN